MLNCELHRAGVGNPGAVEIYLNNIEGIKDHQGVAHFFLRLRGKYC